MPPVCIEEGLSKSVSMRPAAWVRAAQAISPKTSSAAAFLK